MARKLDDVNLIAKHSDLCQTAVSDQANRQTLQWEWSCNNHST